VCGMQSETFQQPEPAGFSSAAYRPVPGKELVHRPNGSYGARSERDHKTFLRMGLAPDRLALRKVPAYMMPTIRPSFERYVVAGFDSWLRTLFPENRQHITEIA
jgi:hypothetical protein